MTRIDGALRRLHGVLPARAHAAPLVFALEVARRRGWLQPPASLDGRRFRLVVEDLGLDIAFHVAGGRFAGGPHGGSAPELTMRARARDYLVLMLGEADTDTLFFQRRLAVEGDTALGLEVKYWLDAAPRPEALARVGAMLGAWARADGAVGGVR